MTATIANLSAPRKSGFAKTLLTWYDKQARVLPWRVSPSDRLRGVMPDPFRVWLSEVMLQQTTVATVRPRFDAFLGRWPDVAALAAAPLEDVLGEWAGLGYYARARNLHACAQAVVHEHDGVFPQTEEGLRSLPGIGPYTAAAIGAIAFDLPLTVIDGNVDRVIVRQTGIEVPIKDAKPQIADAAAALTPKTRPGDYAQAMMDLGAGLCRPKSPQCLLCPVQKMCTAHAKGLAAELPKKAPKKAKPTRYGHVTVGIGSGGVVCERRPAKGLFGGMAGLPGSEWVVDGVPPAPKKGRAVGEIRHTLTHFHLVLQVWLSEDARPNGAEFWTPCDQLETLPTVFRKAANLGLERKGGKARKGEKV